MTPGERIKILRILSGLTQEALAERAGLNRASLVSWEKNNYNPSASAAEALGGVLLCSPGYIIFGAPPPESSAWDPTPPKTSKYLKSYLKDFDSLFLLFCEEAGISNCAYYRAENGILVFLGKNDEPLSFLLFLKQDIETDLLKTIKNLKSKEITGLKGYPPLDLGFLNSETIESLSLYFRIAKSDGIDVRDDYILKDFLASKKQRGLISDKERNEIIKSTFLHFQTIFQEFEESESMTKSFNKSKKIALLEELSIFFLDLHEKINERSLIWRGRPDDDLAEHIRKNLTSRGFRKKNDP